MREPNVTEHDQPRLAGRGGAVQNQPDAGAESEEAEDEDMGEAK